MQSQFDGLAQQYPDEPKIEFWLARGLWEPLGYTRWENFLTAIRRALLAVREILIPATQVEFPPALKRAQTFFF
ncbi:MAG: hypothetical protein GWO81_05260 [Verrucomicrobia bacterium]|nr:hypothetical protein [Verrucomicrobiota bacterium]